MKLPKSPSFANSDITADISDAIQDLEHHLSYAKDAVDSLQYLLKYLKKQKELVE